MIRRALISLLIVGYLYALLATVSRPVSYGLSLPRLPLPLRVEDAFSVYGVFGGYTDVNQTIVIEGLAQVRQGERDTVGRRWIRLDTAAHFPFPRPERERRMRVQRAGQSWFDMTQEAAWRVLADKIAARHNRRHPERLVSRVRIVVLTWPHDPAGYEAARVPGAERRYVLYAD